MAVWIAARNIKSEAITTLIAKEFDIQKRNHGEKLIYLCVCVGGGGGGTHSSQIFFYYFTIYYFTIFTSNFLRANFCCLLIGSEDIKWSLVTLRYR